MLRRSGSPLGAASWQYVRCHDGLAALETVQARFQCSFSLGVYPLVYMEDTGL